MKAASKHQKDLRKNSQCLISSLQKHQNYLKESIDKIKSSSTGGIRVDSANLTTLSSNSVTSSVSSSSSTATKTVSFSDYLRISGSSNKRRAKSADSTAVNAHKNLKPILKKKLDYYVKSSLRESSRASSASSLDDEIADDSFHMDANLTDLIRYKEYNLTEKLKANQNSLIKYIETRRQSYLNHCYLNENDPVDVDETLTTPLKKLNINELEPKNTRKTPQNESKKSNKARSRSADSGLPSYTKPTKSSMSAAKVVAKKADPKVKKPKSGKKSLKKFNKNKPLLGFDFALDSASQKKSNTSISKLEKPENYWEELLQFRSENMEDCVSNKEACFDGTTSSLFDFSTTYNEFLKNNDYDDARNHKCIHSFTLNERLFPVPIYRDKNGQSICPVCKTARKEGNFYSPQFCKVSIPKYRIIEPISVEPCKKSNSHTDDTLSLSGNCVVGYQNAPKKATNLYNMPLAKNIDLKSSYAGGTDNKQTLTITDLKLIETNQDPATCAIYNKAHAMRYELEDQHLKRLRELMPKMQKNN